MTDCLRRESRLVLNGKAPIPLPQTHHFPQEDSPTANFCVNFSLTKRDTCCRLWTTLPHPQEDQPSDMETDGKMLNGGDRNKQKRQRNTWECGSSAGKAPTPRNESVPQLPQLPHSLSPVSTLGGVPVKSHSALFRRPLSPIYPKPCPPTHLSQAQLHAGLASNLGAAF